MRNKNLSTVFTDPTAPTRDNLCDRLQNQSGQQTPIASDLPLRFQECGELVANFIALPFDPADPRFLTAEGVPTYTVEIVSEELWNGAQA